MFDLLKKKLEKFAEKVKDRLDKKETVSKEIKEEPVAEQVGETKPAETATVGEKAVEPKQVEKKLEDGLVEEGPAEKPTPVEEKAIKPIAKEVESDRKSTRLNSSHIPLSRMPSSA